MSNWGIEDASDLGGNNDGTGPKALRDAYEAQKQKTKELEDALASVQNQLRQQAVSATLTELGIPAAAAEQYKGEADPTKVREWATSMQSLFGGGQAVTPGSTPNPAETPQGIDPSTAQQLQQMQEAGQQGQPLGNFEAATARLSDATDIQGLISAWQTIK